LCVTSRCAAAPSAKDIANSSTLQSCCRHLPADLARDLPPGFPSRLAKCWADYPSYSSFQLLILPQHCICWGQLGDDRYPTTSADEELR
jgi:hypothetical protein